MLIRKSLSASNWRIFDEIERPDFLIHSYTKDLQSHGTTIGGCVIGKNERIFLPKGEKDEINNSLQNKEISWEDTMFWNVYYIKGAFLDSEKAFDIIEGIKTLERRMLAKCINTIVLYEYFKSNEFIKVKSSVSQKQLLEKITFRALPAPLMTLDIGVADITRFKAFVDSLCPMFGGMVSLRKQTYLNVHEKFITSGNFLFPNDPEIF